MRKGRIVILSGPSGSGKTTLYKKLLADQQFKKGLVRSLSATTRSPREGEISGRDYQFISKKKFLYKRRAGHFLESQKIFNHYYGTPRKNVLRALDLGKNVLLCIEVKGARAVWQKSPDALKIFVKTRSLNILKARLKARATEGRRDLNLRYQTAKEELKESKHYDYIIINDNLNKAYRKLESILRQELH